MTSRAGSVERDGARGIGTVATVAEIGLTGSDSLSALTALLHRVRQAHPTWGPWEAADVHWWWRLDQRSDPADCLVWSDAAGPNAAVVATRFRDEVLGDLLRLPGAPVTHENVAACAALADRHGAGRVAWACDDADAELAEALDAVGAHPTDEVMIQMWRRADAPVPTQALPSGYAIERRRDQAPSTAHHLARRNGDGVAAHLAASTLYRDDLDLLVRAHDGTVAGYALFWADSTTRVGLVEPVRVEDAHAGRGIATALVTAGARALAAAGCERVKVSVMADNPAAARAYVAAGFQPVATIRTYR